MISFATIYEENISYREIFHLTNVLLNLMPIENYPNELKSRVNNLKEMIVESSQRPREFLKCLNVKPIANKLFEPKMQTK